MRRVWERLLGIEPQDWTDGGGWSLEWLSNPTGDRAFLFLVGAVVVAAGLYVLYRIEGRLVPRGIPRRRAAAPVAATASGRAPTL